MSSLLCALYKCNVIKKAFFFIGCFFPLARALLIDAAKRSDICRLLKKMNEILEVDQTWETMNNEMLQEVVKRSDVFIQGDIDWKCLTPMPDFWFLELKCPWLPAHNDILGTNSWASVAFLWIQNGVRKTWLTYIAGTLWLEFRLWFKRRYDR